MSRSDISRGGGSFPKNPPPLIPPPTRERSRGEGKVIALPRRIFCASASVHLVEQPTMSRASLRGAVATKQSSPSFPACFALSSLQ
jgi:hypothetical protein